MEIKINEPCHENWDAMTPNQQGAFCKSCMKNVVDFSNKTLEEIKDFFSKPQDGRVCGRFEEKQLQELSFDDFFSRFTYWNFSRKFAAIFFVIFGLWIFSNPVNAQERYLKGEVAYTPTKVQHQDTTRQPVMGQAVVKHPVMGKVKCTIPNKSVKNVPPVKIIDPVTKAVPHKREEEQMVVGMIAAIPDQQVIPIINLVKVVPADNKKTLITIIETEREHAVQKEDEKALRIESPMCKAVVYPNPSNGSFTVAGSKVQTMYLHDLNGKLIMTRQIEETALINAEHLQPGTYTLTLTDGSVTSTHKIIIAR